MTSDKNLSFFEINRERVLDDPYLTDEQKIEQTINATLFLIQTLHTEIIPLLPVDLRADRNSAILLTFNRLFLNVQSLCRLRNIFDYQACASIARSNLELYVDLHELSKTEIGFKKFFDWQPLESIRFLKSFVEFDQKNTNLKMGSEKFYSGDLKELEIKENELVQKHWNGNKKVCH